MENLDLFYRAYEEYKKQLDLDPESSKFLRVSKRQSSIENESLNIVYSTVEIDENWVNAIERGLPYVEKAIKEDRQFIRSDGDVVPIEKVRKITKSSIEDLSKHSNYITHESENEDIEVVPDKIFVLNKESDYAIYENKVLYATLIYLKEFVSVRLSKIKELARTLEFNSELNKKIEVSNRKINLHLKIDEKRTNDPHLENRDAQKGIIDRLDDVLRNIMGLLKYPLMVEVAKSDMVSRPITKTNVLRMNTNFRESLALFDYVAEYSGDGYTVQTLNKSFTPFSDSISEAYNDLLMTYSFLSYIYVSELEPELKKRKLEYEAKLKAQNERALLERLRTLKIKATDNEQTLLEYVTLFEQGYRILEKKNDELEEKLKEEEERRIKELDEQKGAYETKIASIEEAHLNEIEKINEKHDLEINSLREEYSMRLEEKEKEYAKRESELIASYETKIKDINEENLKRRNELISSYENDISTLKDNFNKEKSDLNVHFEGIIASKDENIGLLTQNVSNLTSERDDLILRNDALNASIYSMNEIKGSGNDFSKHLEEASFDELEKIKNGFLTFYNKTWKEAKKKIVRDNIKIEKKKKDKKKWRKRKADNINT